MLSLLLPSSCVFTITYDRLANAVADAYRRGVRVRIVTDNEQIDSPGEASIHWQCEPLSFMFTCGPQGLIFVA